MLSSDYEEANRLLAPNLNDEGLKLLRALAEAGDIKAQVRLGGIFDLGKLGFQDKSKAEYWYCRAAESQSSHCFVDFFILTRVLTPRFVLDSPGRNWKIPVLGIQ